ncbi:hypothetical protein NDU88_002107 [Pleurodeles waltl]|uniref:Uncharacterized protein n=1 Tax=Pleurodeles waltl TaxID=8319 RepID=A0AAV7VC64_PLEWA|nr:hypothetical protein NDU88_002107 [Pleurodeles waltl]
MLVMPQTRCPRGTKMPLSHSASVWPQSSLAAQHVPRWEPCRFEPRSPTRVYLGGSSNGASGLQVAEVLVWSSTQEPFHSWKLVPAGLNEELPFNCNLKLFLPALKSAITSLLILQEEYKNVSPLRNKRRNVK